MARNDDEVGRDRISKRRRGF